MRKRKKKEGTMIDVAMGGIMATTLVGTMPSTSGAAGIKTNFATGISKTGKVLPIMGKVKGTKMVLKPITKLKKTTKKLKIKGAYEL